MSITSTPDTSHELPFPISIAGQPYPSTISYMVSFDVGQTFIFKPSDNVDAEWRAIFSGHPHGADWATDQTELKGFKKSMGWIAVWRCFGGTPKPGLDAALEQLGGCVPGVLDTSPDGIRAIIFPNGIAVMIVKVKAAPLGDPCWDIVNDGPAKARRRAACRVILATASACYLDFMYRAVKTGGLAHTPVVQRLRPIERTHHQLRAEFTYPLHFFGTPDEANRFAGTETFAVTPYGDARIWVAWGHALVAGGTAAEQEAIERNFVIALAGWFALVVMNNRAAHFIHSAIHDLAANREPDGLQGEAIRLAYMEASNQAFPVQWTTVERDLLLLELIHHSWSSRRWWENVDRKTNLLAAHSGDVADEADQRWNKKITSFGAFIASFTLASAIVDAMSLRTSARMAPRAATASREGSASTAVTTQSDPAQASPEYPPEFWFAVGLPLAVLAVLLLFARKVFRRGRPKPEEPYTRRIPAGTWSLEPTPYEWDHAKPPAATVPA